MPDPATSRRLPVLIALLALAAPVAAAAQDLTADDFTSDFFVEDCSFAANGRDNPFWSLHPHDQLELEGEEDGEDLAVTITVLPDTETVTFTTDHGTTMRVHTRVVEERERVDGELAEVSRNFFARCRETNAIYYFGEDVDIYEDGEIVGHEGAWRAGEDGAQPGLMMPGTFLLGSRYLQEDAPGVARDAALHADMGLTVDTPAGTFDRCVEIWDYNLIEDPDLEEEPDVKIYCPGVGQVVDETLELVDWRRAGDPAVPAGEWMTAPELQDFRVKVAISADGEAHPVRQETADCDPETVCVSGAVPGRVEVLVRVPGPKPNDCFWPTITKLSTSTVEVWIEQLSTGEMRYYRLDGSSPGSSDLPGFFDRDGFCPGS